MSSLVFLFFFLGGGRRAFCEGNRVSEKKIKANDTVFLPLPSSVCLVGRLVLHAGGKGAGGLVRAEMGPSSARQCSRLEKEPSSPYKKKRPMCDSCQRDFEPFCVVRVGESGKIIVCSHLRNCKKHRHFNLFLFLKNEEPKHVRSVEK